jgi:hypothetical protein
MGVGETWRSASSSVDAASGGSSVRFVDGGMILTEVNQCLTRCQTSSQPSFVHVSSHTASQGFLSGALLQASPSDRSSSLHK